MHDLKQLAKDAERVEASAKAWLSECEGLDRNEIEYHEAERRLAAFARDLTDETPLTVERLADRGGKKLFISAERWPVFDFGTFRVIAEGDVDDWRWVDLGKLNWRINPAPCTVGELAMIEHLMEGR